MNTKFWCRDRANSFTINQMVRSILQQCQIHCQLSNPGQINSCMHTQRVKTCIQHMILTSEEFNHLEMTGLPDLPTWRHLLMEVYIFRVLRVRQCNCAFLFYIPTEALLCRQGVLTMQQLHWQHDFTYWLFKLYIAVDNAAVLKMISLDGAIILQACTCSGPGWFSVRACLKPEVENPLFFFA
jgi:hypothetical protein